MEKAAVFRGRVTFVFFSTLVAHRLAPRVAFEDLSERIEELRMIAEAERRTSSQKQEELNEQLMMLQTPSSDVNEGGVSTNTVRPWSSNLASIPASTSLIYFKTKIYTV